jgi:hypothetical protein
MAHARRRNACLKSLLHQDRFSFEAGGAAGAAP